MGTHRGAGEVILYVWYTCTHGEWEQNSCCAHPYYDDPFDELAYPPLSIAAASFVRR
jgi:hypothetical protein